MGMLLASPRCSMNMAVIKAVSDNARLKILEKISKGEVCACQLPCCACISQPATSQHLGVLLKAGLVKVVKRGKHRYYSLSKKGSQILKDVSKW
jgi:ArsR family transcriptional regulator